MIPLSRRQFIRDSAAATTALTLFFNIPFTQTKESALAGQDDLTFRPNSRLSIDAKGQVTVHIEKAEMGQGVTTALAQIVAEELEANWNQVSASLNTYKISDGFVVTASSWSIFTLFDSASRAAAAARIILVKTAARHFGVEPSACRAINSVVNCGDRQLTYAEIVALKPAELILTKEALEKITLKTPGQYKVIGKPQPSPKQDQKLQGTLKFGIDQYLPGMVYAKVVYPPSIGETHRNVDDSSAKNMPGYIATIVNENVVAVVADSYPAAVAARDALKVEWNEGPNSKVNSADLWATFKQKVGTEDGRPWVRKGDADAALNRADRLFNREYATELAAHLQMEPYNCTAEYTNGEIHLYCGTQYQTRLVKQAAEMCGVDESKIFVHEQYMGGSFGALVETECQAHAAVIAKAIGKPVKLILSREEDTLNDKFRSPSYHRLTCGLNKVDSIQGWEHRVVSAWPSSRQSLFLNKDGYDSFALSGSDHYYGIGDQHVRAIEHDLGTPVGYVRGVSCGYMFFAIESFIDELAHDTNQDPLEIRLKLLEDRSRLSNVLIRAAELGGWGKQLPKNTGLGLSAVTAQDSESNTTRLASVAQVNVRPSGEIRVEKISCVVDCGIVINPAGATAMAEGALLYGLSIALKGSGTIKKGSIVERNFDQYNVLRMSDVPEIQVEFIDSSEPPTGMGEPAMCCAAPAVANAVFSAVGARVRKLPFTEEQIRLAMTV